MSTISTDLTSIANELSATNPRLSIRLHTLSIEAARLERAQLIKITGDASEPVGTNKTGTYDTLIRADGAELLVLIVEDTPAHMVVRAVETGQIYTLAKPLQ